MNNWKEVLDNFIFQAQTGDLKTSSYPKEWAGLRMKTSFGMGIPARIPWVGFMAPEMSVSRGINPVYLYYKDLNTLILAYGISETEESPQSWPAEIMNSTSTIAAYFDQPVPRYGDSFVFKAYEVRINNDKVEYVYKLDTGPTKASTQDIESDLSTIIEYYKKIVSLPSSSVSTEVHKGLFYMEKQLEDFLIHNWENTELGKKYDLIIEEGELLSQQYRTDIGPIDILAKDKQSGGYVVIELKKDQTSDDTVGQVARYMGWVKESKKTDKVSGVIIAGQYDQKLDYALKAVPNVEVFLYEVDFRLSQFTR